jgi:two-component system, cell cycle sensor histidine kinase and response regulator CckA
MRRVVRECRRQLVGLRETTRTSAHRNQEYGAGKENISMGATEGLYATDVTRVLVVEADRTECLKLAATLTGEGYGVEVACDGEEGFASARANPPDLVLSGIEMPEMDGYELCRRIRAEGPLQNTRVVLLTSHADIADLIRGMEAGADNYITKPYASATLLDVVRTLLAGRGDPLRGESPEVLPVRLGAQVREVRCTRYQIVSFFLSMYRDSVTRNTEVMRLVEEHTAELREEILQRRQAEEETRLRAALVDKAHEAIMLLDVNGCVQFWNMGAQRLYGWTANELLGMTLGGVLHDEHHPAPSDALRIALERGEWAGELVQLTKDGKERNVQSSWTVVLDDDGIPGGILTINVDITERKKLEAKFLRTQRLESIGMLAGGIAHDLNNLVGPILMAVQVLRGKITGDNEEQMLRLIESGARRSLDVVQQVLAFSRGTSGMKIPLQPKHLLREMHDMAKGSFPPSIDFSLVYPPKLSLVLGDATQLHQVIMNLCVNARDAMPNGGSIVLRADEVTVDEAYAVMLGDARPGKYVRLSVKDSGVGIPAHLKEKIFDPFFTTKEPGAGTGLGLSTVLSIVRAHEGFLRVESEPGCGTEFQVFLPTAEGSVEHALSKVEAPAPCGNGEMVLVVDDELIVREIVKSSLEAAGYHVLTANDGIDALALFAHRGKEINAVVVDLLMPNLDGPATIKTLRKMNPAVCIMAISGHEDAAKHATSHLPPSVPILRKPFTAQKLMATIHEMIHVRRATEVGLHEELSATAE